MNKKLRNRVWTFSGVLLLLLIAFNLWYFSAKILDPVSLEGTIRESDHQVCLLDIGKEALALRISLIRQAKESVCIQTFIWTDDQTGRLLISELIDAAKRGVKVKIIADQMFSETDPEIIAALATVSPNLEIKHYNPLSEQISATVAAQLSAFAQDFKGANQRMHNKVMIIDDTSAITGGRNIEDTYFDNARGLNFKDRDVFVIGPVVKDMTASFTGYWMYPLSVKSSDLKDVSRAIENGEPDLSGLADNPLKSKVDAVLSNGLKQEIADRLLTVNKVAFFADNPGKDKGEDRLMGSLITRQLISVIGEAKASILIQSPYLVFGDGALAFFKELKENGIQLTASTNSLAATDSWLAYSMLYKQKKALIEDVNLYLHELKPIPADIDLMFPDNQAIRDEMLEISGARHDPDKPDLSKVPYLCMHAKSMVIDRDIGCVGSFNFDPRSANLNTEVALIVWDATFADQLAENIERDMLGKNSWIVWKKQRPLAESQLSGLFNFLSDRVEGVTTVDLWPATHTSAFQLKPGKKGLLPGNPNFYRHYDSVGSFPMVPVGDEKEIYTRLFKMFGKIAKPIL